MRKISLSNLIAISALVASIVLGYEIYRLPTMILSSVFLVIFGGIALYITCSLIAGLINLFLKESFTATFFIALFTLSVYGILTFHKPTYEIHIPKDYYGEVHLVLSNLDNNVLNIDTNGIGYLNEKTFNKGFHPKILENGIDISNRTVGFSNSSFWAIRSAGSYKSLTFNIKPKSPMPDKFNPQISNFINKGWVKKPD